jgi:ABC-type phosphate transport system substrate-binding protein
MKTSSFALALASAAFVLGATTAARADDCSTLTNPVYATGSSAFKAILGELAKTLAGGASPTTIVYEAQGSCDGVDAVLNGTPITTTSTTASFWNTAGTEMNCDIASPGIVVDVGISDVFPTTCFNLPNGLPSDVEDFAGPVQPMVFVVPKLSKQLSISAEAAYFVYGFGKTSGVSPWDDPPFLFTRDGTSGTEQMIAAAIGVTPAQWQGTAATSTDDMRTKVATSSNPEATLGIIVADAADSNRDNITELAYQHFDQTCGYWPDSDPMSFDKRNVRDGHYAIWGPLHLLSKVNAQGYPVNAAAKDVIGYITGTETPPGGLDIIQLEAQNHVVPQCAMHVKRTEELGPLASTQPAKSCGCIFEKLAGGTTDCKPCTNVNTCPSTSTACNFGYCED